MGAFRIFLILIFVTIAVYTSLVASHHGLGLLGVFFRDIAAMGWPGQFNLDFLSFLILSALWLAWRHQFSPAGLVLAVMGLFGGGLFLSAYLLVASFAARAHWPTLLLGPGRTQPPG